MCTSVYSVFIWIFVQTPEDTVGFYSYQNTRKETEGVRNLRHSYAVEIRPEVDNIVKLKKKKEKRERYETHSIIPW